MIWIGFNPTPFLERMEPSVNVVLEQVNGSGPQAREGQGGEVKVTLTDATSPPDEEGPDETAPTLPGDQE
jgi:hypothetical protein